MTKQKTIAGFILLALALSLGAVEVGLNGGWNSDFEKFTYGLSLQSTFIVSLIKLEFEGFKVAEEAANQLSAGAKARFKLGKFWPYGGLGVGLQFDELLFDFDAYQAFSFICVGFHLKPSSLFSLRLDGRILNFSDRSPFRISAGIFLHL